MLRPFARLWIIRALVPALVDLAILFLALMASIAIRNPALFERGLVGAFAPLCALFLLVFSSVGLYELRRVRDFVALINCLLISAGVCLVVGTVYFYLFSPYLDESPKTFLVMIVVLSHTAIFGWRRALLTLTDFNLTRLRLLVLADEDHLDHLRQDQERRSTEGLDLADSLGPDVDLVVADSAWIEGHWDTAKVVLSSAVEYGVPVVSLERFYESMFGKVSPQYASDPSWALEHILPRADEFYPKARRGFDLALSAVGLVALTPVLLAVAALIRLIDGMPPLYGQTRVGYLGKQFTLWKFQTMRPNADAAGPFPAATEGTADERVTRLGGFLRRFRLDEFPQLWNVMRGEMSLVGPRPEWVKEVEILEGLVPNYHLRHLVLPGITGWAQVYFRATNSPRDSIEKHHFDLYYLKHFSPALDLSILLKTIKRVFVKDARISVVHTPFPRYVHRVTPTAIDIASIITRN